MSSPTSVDFLPRRLESIAVSPSPKKKRIKRTTQPEPSFPIVTNLDDLPSDLLHTVLAFLTPNLDNPVHSECALVGLSRASKLFRALALNDRLWYHVCVGRWETKVEYAARVAKAEAEAKKDTNNTFVKGGYWYHKFFAEERDAARTTITQDELYSTTFSLRLWFCAPSYPPNIKKTKGIAPSGLDGNSLSDALHFYPDGTTTILPGYNKEHAIFEMNKEGSIINIGATLEQGIHRSYTHYVHRRKDWGWELRSQVFAIRSLLCKDNNDINGLWSDYASNLVVEYRKKGVVCHRGVGRKKYTRREVPDAWEIKEFLVW